MVYVSFTYIAFPPRSRPKVTSRQSMARPRFSERHRHRYEVNTRYREKLEKAGLVFSGMSPDGGLPEIVERPDHPWFVGVQYHPNRNRARSNRARCSRA